MNIYLLVLIICAILTVVFCLLDKPCAGEIIGGMFFVLLVGEMIVMVIAAGPVTHTLKNNGVPWQVVDSIPLKADSTEPIIVDRDSYYVYETDTGWFSTAPAYEKIECEIVYGKTDFPIAVEYTKYSKFWGVEATRLKNITFYLPIDDNNYYEGTNAQKFEGDFQPPQKS